MIDENRIAVDLSQLSDNTEYDLDFQLTDKEKKYFPNLISLGDLKFYMSVISSGTLYSLVIHEEGEIKLSDCHDMTEKTYPLNDEVEVIINPSDEENSDVLADDDGLYDLRGSILALLFNTIPQNYSEVPLTKIKGENYVLMSEEEYEKEKKKNSNAFSALDDIE